MDRRGALDIDSLCTLSQGESLDFIENSGDPSLSFNAGNLLAGV